MNTRKVVLILVIVLVLVFAMSPGRVFGEELKESKNQGKKEKAVFHPHEEIVVTATMTQKAVKDCSSSVSVVTLKDIESLRPSSSLNILNFFPGIFLQRTGDFGRADVEIRGLGQRGTRITIMTDGRPEKMGLFGCAVTHAFPLDNISRIEVVRGPASVLYGSDALGGVINILTKKPAQGFQTDLATSYGTFNTQEFTLQHGAGLKNWNYFVTLDRRSSDGHIPRSQYAGNDVTGRVEWTPTEHLEVSFQGKYFSGEKHDPGPLSFPDAWSWNDYKRGALDMSLRGKWDQEEFFWKIYRDFGHHEFSDGWLSRDTVDGGVLRFTSHRWRNNEFTIGADVRASAGRSYHFPSGTWKKHEMAVFLQNEHVFFKKWILSTGGRLNKDSSYGYEFCPHFGLVFLPQESTRLKVVANRGFRSPQLNELFMFPASNPGLKPERVWNYEMGVEQSFGTQIVLKATVFRMKGSNFIETNRNPSPPPLFKFMNTGRISFSGVELEWGAAFSRSLSANVFYTYLNPGEKTKGRPGQKFDFLIRLEQGPVDFTFLAQHVRDYYAADFSWDKLPSYFLLNGRMDIHLSRRLTLLVDGNNLLNKDYRIYADLPGTGAGVYPMPKRAIKLGLRVHL